LKKLIAEISYLAAVVLTDPVKRAQYDRQLMPVRSDMAFRSDMTSKSLMAGAAIVPMALKSTFVSHMFAVVGGIIQVGVEALKSEFLLTTIPMTSCL
jgi:hypothetical protein